MLAFLITIAFALPSYLGPDGVTHIGMSGESSPNIREDIVVHPRTGALWIENPDGRVWKGDHWEGASAQNPNHQFVQSRLTVAIVDGEKYIYFYDEEGRIALIHWSNGKRIRIRYRDDGRVYRLEGGIGHFWNLKWGRALIVQRQGYPTQRLSYLEENEGYRLTVTENSGRQVESGYKQDVLQYWVDPIGTRTDLEWKNQQLNIRTSSGRTWQIGFDSERNWTSLVLPDLATWVWRRNAQGALVSQLDPLGRRIDFKNNDSGMISSISTSIRTVDLTRDAKDRLIKAEDSLGIQFRMTWNDANQVSSLIDATQSAVQFRYDSDGQVRQITDRSGGNWFFERSRYGLLSRIITPDQSVWSIGRDSRGLPNQLKTPYSILDMDRNHQGHISVLHIDGEKEFSFVRDWNGNVRTILHNGRRLRTIQWNHLREPTTIVDTKEKIILKRDSGGWIGSFAGYSFTRDQLGRITSVQKNREKYSFTRDLLGRITKVRRGDYFIDIGYDSHDLPLFWKESNGASSIVERNIRGQITKDGDIELFYDSRGMVSKAKIKGNSWKWARDISGRILQIASSGGSKLGFDRESHGLIRYIRYPNNTMLRFFRDSDQLETRLIESNSKLLEQIWYKWNRYSLLEESRKGDTRTFFRRDPDWNVVAVERNDGVIWSKTPDGISDGLQGKSIFSFEGQVVGVQPPIGCYPYNKELGYLAYHRDSTGRISEMVDASDRAVFSYDGLNRLRTICFRKTGCWKLFYDPRGMLSGFRLPGDSKQKIYWRPDIGKGEFGSSVLLAAGNQMWLQGPTGLLVSEEEGKSTGYVFDPQHRLRWMLGEKNIQPYPSLAMSYMGEVAPIFGQAEALQLGAAGPVLKGDIAYEPFSDQRYDGVDHTDHSFDDAMHRLPSLYWDSYRSVWRDPISILSSLSLLGSKQFVMDVSSKETLMQWMPDSYQYHQEYVIHPFNIPMNQTLDPLVTVFLRTIVEGNPDPEQTDILGLILQQELQVSVPKEDIVENIIWWNSLTKLDPRLANVFFLE